MNGMNSFNAPTYSRLSSRLATLALAFVLASTTGCTYLKELIGLGVQKPRVTFLAASITKLSLRGIDLVIDINVENPNSFDLNFAKIDYQLVASGMPVARGELASKVQIPAEGQHVVHVPLTINGEYAVKLMRDLMSKPSQPPIAFLTANAAFDTPLGPMLVTFEDQRPLHKLTGR
ncbi:MAG: LEA type 2 family protein [Deltaproteobacteria bacterium]|nr:LEA type 2 family protein [Deltaproteobacteria bacterium]